MSSSQSHSSRILILDFGSQYTQLIARRVRELHVYCEIHPGDEDLEAIRAFEPTGLILSGGPASVLEADAPDVDPALFELGIPILGICYGLQLMVQRLGGEVEAADDREYGRAQLEIEQEDPLLAGLRERTERVVWMSHGDRVLSLPPGFRTLAHSGHSPFAAVRCDDAPIWGLQFHPEVAHTDDGLQILENFVRHICQCTGDWTTEAFIEESVQSIRDQVGRLIPLM